MYTGLCLGVASLHAVGFGGFLLELCKYDSGECKMIYKGMVYWFTLEIMEPSESQDDHADGVRSSPTSRVKVPKVREAQPASRDTDSTDNRKFKLSGTH
jgi:hypothetical protein